jgi:hypothetical protein
MKFILFILFLELPLSVYTQTDTSMHFNTSVCFYNVNATIDTVNKIYIKGKVFEAESKLLMIGAVVKIKNIEAKDISSLVNPKGEYALEIPKSASKQKKLVIESSYDGFKTSEITINKSVKNTVTLNIYLTRGKGVVKSNYLITKKVKASN